MSAQKITLKLQLDYLTDTDRDDQTFTFDLCEMPPDRLTPHQGIPSDPSLGVFYEWEGAGDHSSLKLCVKAPHVSATDPYRLPNRKLTAIIPAELALSVVSHALEHGHASIGARDAGKLLVAIGDALQRDGEEQ